MIQSPLSVEDQLHYQVAIVLPHSKEILAEGDGDSRRLPTITIPRWRRVAEQITNAIKLRWNLQTVVVDSLASSDDAPGLAILEALSCDDSVLSNSLQRSHLNLIRLDPDFRDRLQEVLDETNQDRNPLLRLGWINEARKWLQENVRDHEIQFTNDICQLNAGAGFALIRLGVSHGPAYWIKATATPNRHEAAIAQMLSKCSPASSPPLVAVHQQWNAWAMEEVGTSLTDSVDAGVISIVAVSLARLQQETMNYQAAFLDRGCGDQRTATLYQYLPAFVDCATKLISERPVEAATKDFVDPVSRVEYTLRFALERMERLGIPDTINNNDIKLANILFDGRRCVFIDWCHAYWGNPFLTFQHLQIYLSRRLSVLSHLFQETYAGAWAAHLSESQIEVALALAPIIAPYAYLCARGPESLISRASDPSMRNIFLNIVHRILAAEDQLTRKERQAYA